MTFMDRFRAIPDPGMITAVFDPKPDITAFELALIVQNLSGISPPKSGVSFTQPQWDFLPEEIRRHFRVRKIEKVA